MGRMPDPECCVDFISELFEITLMQVSCMNTYRAAACTIKKLSDSVAQGNVTGTF